MSTEILVEGALSIIAKNRELLRASNHHCRLDDLLKGMLEYAPHASGQRHTAISIHIAQDKGGEALIDVAKAWLDHLFFPMMVMSRVRASESSSTIESAAQSEQSTLRAQVEKREKYHCAITQAFDLVHADRLIDRGRADEIPDGRAQHAMEVVHIIPLLLHDFDDRAMSSPAVRDAARTWDMLHSWTGIDITDLVGSKINAPANAIFMTTTEHAAFGQFRFYLDKDVFLDNPNKYKACMALGPGACFSNGQTSADIEFPTFARSGIEPPNPEFIEVHAAFAKVLNLCGADQYLDHVEWEMERNTAL